NVRPVTEARRESDVPTPASPGALRLPALQRPRPADLRPEAVDPPSASDAGKAADPLTGRRQNARALPAAPREMEAPLKAEASPRDRRPEDVRVTVPRRTTLSPQAPARAPDESKPVAAVSK